MKRLDSVRIKLPNGSVYDALELARKMHKIPSLSKYILYAAWEYTEAFARDRARRIKEREDEQRNLSQETNSPGTAGSDQQVSQHDGNEGSLLEK